jgi:hypothetical protein
MLGTLLDKLQSLFSKNLVIGSIPLFAFLLANSLMAYRVSYHFQVWVKTYFFSQDSTRQALLSFVILLIVIILSYVLSTLSVLMREILEGKHLLGSFLANVLSQRYRDRLIKIEGQLRKARTRYISIRQNQQRWVREISAAYQLGKTTQTCTYRRPTDANTNIDTLLNLRRSNQEVTLEALKPQVDAVIDALKRNNLELLGDEYAASCEALDEDQGKVLQLIRYVADKARAEYATYLTEFQFDYAGEEVAPTKMGNISRVAPHYAATRYSMNLDVLWTRLQKVAASDTNFYSGLQDAKMQVDFLVGLVWYSILFTLTWVGVLPFLGEGRNLFPWIAVLGPLISYAWYSVALQNYRAFADVLCATVDLFRLDLLKVLHVPLPVNAEQELLLWESIEQRLVYGEHLNYPLQS